MSKNLRIIIPAILLALIALGFWWRGAGTTRIPRGDASVVVAVDAGVAVAADTGAVADAAVAPVADAASGADGAVALMMIDAGASAGDAGSPDHIVGCGNCRLDPATGALTVQMQARLPEEPGFTWTVTGVEIFYNGVPNPTLRNVTGGFPPITADSANCSTTRTFTVQTASPANISAINVRMMGTSGSGQVAFKRGCVKLVTGGGVTILEKDCKCCNCNLCTDVGSCN